MLLPFHTELTGPVKLFCLSALSMIGPEAGSQLLCCRPLSRPKAGLSADLCLSNLLQDILMKQFFHSMELVLVPQASIQDADCTYITKGVVIMEYSVILDDRRSVQTAARRSCLMRWGEQPHCQHAHASRCRWLHMDSRSEFWPRPAALQWLAQDPQTLWEAALKSVYWAGQSCWPVGEGSPAVSSAQCPPEPAKRGSRVRRHYLHTHWLDSTVPATFSLSTLYLIWLHNVAIKLKAWGSPWELLLLWEPWVVHAETIAVEAWKAFDTLGGSRGPLCHGLSVTISTKPNRLFWCISWLK